MSARTRILMLCRSQDESSEEFIGEWMEARGIRDQIVLATKVRACRRGRGGPDADQAA